MKISGKRPMTIAAATNQSRRDVIKLSILAEREDREIVSDIFGALLGNQARWPKGKHDQEQREHDDVDQAGV